MRGEHRAFGLDDQGWIPAGGDQSSPDKGKEFK